MSSEKTFKVFLDVGNTHTRQRGSGYSVVLSQACASRHRTGTNAMDSRNEDTGKEASYARVSETGNCVENKRCRHKVDLVLW